MQVEAIYTQGRLAFVNPIQLKHDHLRLLVEVPDDELLTPPASTYQLSPEQAAQAQTMLDKYQAILNAPMPPDDELPQLSVNFQDRLDAMELRAQLRSEQGRPV